MLFLFIATLLVSGAVADAAPKLSFEELQKLKPVSGNSTVGSPTQYLVTSLYKDGKTCSGDYFQASGVGFGTCMGGSGYSMSYISPKQNADGIEYTMNYYGSNDCTGPTTYSVPMSYSNICYPTSGSGMKFSLVSSVTPWESFGAGVVGQIYNDAGSCAAGGASNTFSFTKLNACFEISNNGAAAAYDKSEMFTSCASTVDYTIWDDTQCTKNPVVTSAPPTACVLDAANKIYSTVTCGK